MQCGGSCLFYIWRELEPFLARAVTPLMITRYISLFILGCRKKVPQIGGLKQWKCIFSLLEARSLRSRCWQFGLS